MERLDSDIKIVKVEPFFFDEKCRLPFKFGAVVLEESTFCLVRVRAQNRKGRTGVGWGGILLADSWCFPAADVPHGKKDAMMRALVEQYAALYEAYEGCAHPIDLFVHLEQEFDRIKRNVCAEMQLEREMPYLGALVCASPIDAAVHDAFGQVNAIDTYRGYGKEFMAHDLGRHLGPAFAGRYIADYLRQEYAARLPVFHLVGGLDKLREAEIDANDPQDGLPISLDQWIRRDGLFCFKVKLNGRDLAWDLDRIAQVSAVARHTKGDAARLHYSLDTNEQCASPDYVVELLHKLRERSRRTYDEVLYIEQPTGRNLRADAFELREAAALKPVIVDESLIGLNDFYFAMDHGWSGIALKTCKCQSKALLFACLAEQMGIPYTVQDLSNPGIALVQSVGLAARLNPMLGVESNAVQFFPQTSAPEARVHRGIFNRSNGFVDTESIRGHGLGLQVGRLDRTIFEIDR